MAVIEIVRFRTQQDVEPERFAQVDAEVGRTHVSRQPGFISRETAHHDHEWIVVVHWESTEAADASMSTYESAPAASEQMALMEAGSMSMERFTTV